MTGQNLFIGLASVDNASNVDFASGPLICLMLFLGYTNSLQDFYTLVYLKICPFFNVVAASHPLPSPPDLSVYDPCDTSNKSFEPA